MNNEITEIAPQTVYMSVDKVCGKVVRYKSNDPSVVVDNVYVSKTFADPMPQLIKVTIEKANKGEHI